MAHIVKWITYTQFCGVDYFGNDSELETDEEYEEEYDTYEQAKHEARQDKIGTRGQYVEVYIDGKYFRDYEV